MTDKCVCVCVDRSSPWSWQRVGGICPGVWEDTPAIVFSFLIKMGGIIDVQDIYNTHTHNTWAELCSSQFSVSLARWCGYTLTQGQHGNERRLFPGLGLVIHRVAALVRQWAVWVLNPAPWHSVQQVGVSYTAQRSWDICSRWKHCWVMARTLPKLRHLLLHLN